MIRLLCILVAFSSLMPLAAAERGFVPVRRTEGSYVALVIGNGAYPDAQLANPVNDATDVAAALEVIGFRVTRLLDADREQMAAGIAQFGDQISKAKAAVFFYAGHGVQVKGENWLLPIGRTAATQITEEGQVEYRSVNAGEVLAKMVQAKVPMNLVVLDSCRNNPFKGAGRGKVQGLAELNAPVGSVVMYSTSPGSVAADGTGRNSPFTAAFLKHLQTPGLDVRLMVTEINATVGDLTNGVQVPWTNMSLRQGFTFVPAMTVDEKLAAEMARKTEELRQAEMQDKLIKLSAEARQSDVAKQRELEAERKRVEASLAASKQVAADITKQLETDLAAAREREQAELGTAKTREDTALAAKQQEIAVLDAKIAAMKAKSSLPGTGADADLDALVTLMNQRKDRKAELQRMEREAVENRANAAAEAAERRRQGEAAAAERRRKLEAEAEAKRQDSTQAEQAKAAELSRLQAAERKALADRLERDLAKYRVLATSEEGRDLAPTAWAKICTIYKTGEVKQGDERELTERVLPGWLGDLAAEHAFTDGDRRLLEGFAAQFPQHARAAEARRQASLIPVWASGNGKDASGTWAKLVVGDQTQVLRLVPAGSFTMDKDEYYGKSTQVTLSAFWLGDSEVTQGLWQAVMGSNPGLFKGTDNPVESVSWDDCQGFFQKVNGQVPGLRAGFPTEAQWEYACRAGATGDYAGDLKAFAWYGQGAFGTTHPVKTKQANAFGIYDMLGNVEEWCADWFDKYTAGSQRDPTGPTSGSLRVLRGGSKYSVDSECASGRRGKNAPSNSRADIGFRIAAQATP